MEEDRMLSDEILLGIINAKSGGGGGGTTNYNQLSNKPQIAGVTLSGDKSLADLGIASATAVSGILDGTDINSFGDVESALALKQNATDNSLDTEAKTIVGAINENAGDISTLKSGLTNLSEEVNGDATTYDFADVVTIENAVPANLADCSVKVEPVQDLHGYDKPWVGGANVNNLFPCPRTAQTITKGGYTATTDGNGYYTITGNSSNFVDIYFDLDKDYTTPDGSTHTLAIQNSVVNNQMGMALYYNDTFIEQGLFSETDRKIHYQGLSQVTYNQIGFRLKGDFSDPLTMKPYIYLGNPSDNVPFSPFENICPISGHTEAVVTREGVNLCPIAKVNTLNSNTFVLNAGTYTASFRMVGRGIYTTSSIILRDSNNTDICSIKAGESGAVKNGQFTLQSKTTLHWYVNNVTTGTDGYYIDNIQIELGSTATPYEPYQGKTYTLALGDTIYGGTVDFETGVMTVTHGIHACDGTETISVSASGDVFRIERDNGNSFMDKFNVGHGTASDWWKIPQVSHYKGIDYIESSNMPNGTSCCYIGGKGVTIAFKDTNCSSASDFTAYLLAQYTNGTPVTFRLLLDTPLNIQLSPEQIQLLQGTNTLYASTGDISVTVNGVSGAIGGLTSGKQDKTDYALETTAKTVVGAINEVNGGLTNYENQNNLNLEVSNRKNLFDKGNTGNLTGRALNPETGEPYVTSGWMTSNFIKIDPSTTYTLTTTSVSSSVAFYDSEKTYISGAASFGTKTTPSNAKYLRFDYKTESADIMQLELGSTATAYAPYIPSVESRLEAVESKMQTDTFSGTTDAYGNISLDNYRYVIAAYSGGYVCIPFEYNYTRYIKILSTTTFETVANTNVSGGYTYIA